MRVFAVLFLNESDDGEKIAQDPHAALGRAAARRESMCVLGAVAQSAKKV
jgi:hypothetical protein